jgi:diguanylate cyclase
MERGETHRPTPPEDAARPVWSPLPQLDVSLDNLARCRAEMALDDRALAAVRRIHATHEADIHTALAPVFRFAARGLAAASPGDKAWSRRMSSLLRCFLVDITRADLRVERIVQDIALWQAVARKVNLLVFCAPLFSRYQCALSDLAATIAARQDAWPDRALRAMNDLAMFHMAVIGTTMFAVEMQGFKRRVMYDEATQMPNQLKLVQRVRERVASTMAQSDEEESLALIKVELRFPDRDDLEHGRASLDATMNQFGERLKRMLRPNDVVGRTGRREFTMILGSLRGEGHAVLAGQRVMQVLRKPIRIGERTLVAHTTVGIVIHPTHGTDADVLLDNLTLATESARAEATGMALYSEANASADASQRSLEHDLRFALHGNELMLYYHPQVELATGRLVGAEGLVRWITAEGKWISPSDIVRAAETGGMMTALTSWAINSAMRQWSALQRAGVDVPISVNLAATDLQDPEFYPALEQALETWSMPPDRLVLEITEGSMIQNVDQILELLHRIRARGIQIAIDDFGTGYSSLAYLRKMPISELKIDQSFVRNMLRDPGAARIVRSVIDLAHNLDMHTVAEGVEDAQTVAALRELHCDRIQGYLLTKPIPVDLYAEWAREWQPDSLGAPRVPAPPAARGE